MYIHECVGKLCRRQDPLFGKEWGLIIHPPKDQKTYWGTNLCFYDVPFITYIYDGFLTEMPLTLKDVLADDWEYLDGENIVNYTLNYTRYQLRFDSYGNQYLERI